MSYSETLINERFGDSFFHKKEKKEDNLITKKAKEELKAFQEKFGKDVANHLREFAKKNNYTKKYKTFDMNAIECTNDIFGCDIKICDNQGGGNDQIIEDWEKQNPGKRWEDEPSLSNEWYEELMDEGKSYINSTFDKANKDKKFVLKQIKTHNFDDGYLYIIIEVSDSYLDKLRSEQSVNEAFILNKEERLAQKRKLNDLEFSYDKKYNATCLRLSGYSVDRLENTLSAKKKELEEAKRDKKSAKDRYGRLEAQVKIDYLNNIIKKISTMIKKKKSYS